MRIREELDKDGRFGSFSVSNLLLGRWRFESDRGGCPRRTDHQVATSLGTGR